jgi:hypothetical protein
MKEVSNDHCESVTWKDALLVILAVAASAMAADYNETFKALK